jgi:hypothetical protein
MNRLSLLLCALAAATAYGSELRHEINSALRASKTGRISANSQICYDILDAWWDRRVELNAWINNDDGTVSQSDELCGLFSGDGNIYTDGCNSRNDDDRAALIAQLKLDDTIDGIDMHNIPCIMTGTNVSPENGRRCVSNYCNQLNDGTCDLRSSGGNCVWWTQNDINKINSATGNSMRGLGHGCYRNPCNMPGEGQQSEVCPDRGNGIFECTWCYGSKDGVKDSKLFGQGMGCQSTLQEDWDRNVNTNTAPINSNVIPDNQIMSVVKNGRTNRNVVCGSASRLCAFNMANAGTASVASEASDGEYACLNNADVPTEVNGITICQGSS